MEERKSHRSRRPCATRSAGSRADGRRGPVSVMAQQDRAAGSGTICVRCHYEVGLAILGPFFASRNASQPQLAARTGPTCRVWHRPVWASTCGLACLLESAWTKWKVVARAGSRWQWLSLTGPFQRQEGGQLRGSPCEGAILEKIASTIQVDDRPSRGAAHLILRECFL